MKIFTVEIFFKRLSKSLNYFFILKSPSIISAHFAFILFILTKGTVQVTVHRQSTDEKKSHLLSEMGWG